MRFLMLNWRDPRNPISGGAERVSLAYLKELARRGHEVCWFANDFPGAAREENFAGIKIVRGGGKGTSVFKARHWYRSQKKFDLVIDQHHGIAVVRALVVPNQLCRLHPRSSRPDLEFILSVAGQRAGPGAGALDALVLPATCRSGRRRNPPGRLLQQHGVREIHVFPNGTDAAPLAEMEPKPLDSPLRLVAVSTARAEQTRGPRDPGREDLAGNETLDVRLTNVGTGEV